VEYSDEAAAGRALSVLLTWGVVAPLSNDYVVFVHLEDDAGQVYGYGDGPPRGGLYPTWIWEAGEVIVDEHALLVEPGAPAGMYNLVVGLYNAGGRLPAFAQDGTRWRHDAVNLGRVEVR
jgi:hypothetical protein